MKNLEITTTSGERTLIDTTSIVEFSGKLRGELFYPGDNGYESARKIWNGMIDRKPGVIVRCIGPSDVVQAVNFAKNNNLLIAGKLLEPAAQLRQRDQLRTPDRSCGDLLRVTDIQ